MSGRIARNWVTLLGSSFLLIAAVMLAVCCFVTYSRLHMLNTWPVAQGVIVDAQLTEEQGSNGGTLCGAWFKVHYTANGQLIETEHRSSSTSSDCAAWTQDVAQMKGSSIRVLYDPADPRKAYPGARKDFAFFLSSVITGGLALAFLVAGSLLIALRKKLQPAESLVTQAD